MRHHSATTSMQRRSFLKGILAAGTFSMISPRGLWADDGASATAHAGQKVRLACIGIGNQGALDISALYKTGLAEIVALCDTEIDGPRTNKSAGKPPNAVKSPLTRFPKAARFQDFRKMFDKMADKIDAVLIATPDFSHFPATILAMSLGKHVFVEKPMAHSFRQLELLIAAEKKYKVATQMGNQGHSGANFFQFKAWTEAGLIKDITRINAHMNGVRRWHDKGAKKFSTLKNFLPKQDIPAYLDWESWLATALDHDFNNGYLNGEWRSWYDFGNGALGDWGAHIFDTAHEFLELGLPVEVDPVKIEGHNPFVFPQASTLAFKFPARGKHPALTLTWYDGQKNVPPLPANAGEIETDSDIPPPGGASADKSGIKVPPNGKEIYAADGTIFQGGTHGMTLRILDKEKAAAAKRINVPASPSNHYKNFLLAAQGKETTRSPFSVAGPLCEAMAIGILAQRVNARLTFDPATKRITNHEVADKLLDGVPPRPGWEQFYKL